MNLGENKFLARDELLCGRQAFPLRLLSVPRISQFATAYSSLPHCFYAQHPGIYKASDIHSDMAYSNCSLLESLQPVIYVSLTLFRFPHRYLYFKGVICSKNSVYLGKISKNQNLLFGVIRFLATKRKLNR